tara:strand:+ start:552 stop:995 length:444 start_codon:yes stop_codon:yes gene_type:complete
MTFNKKYLLLTIFLIIIIHSLIYTNNKQETSFRYFKWNIQEVSVGKLINISFFSGLFITTLLNTKVHIIKKNNSENIGENNQPPNNDEYIKSKIEMPPERDIRDTQPTISVNYRVVKNIEENNLKMDKNYSNSFDNIDDWDNDNNDW